MRSIVICFSQTGNTRKVAKAICDAIEAANGQCDIVRLEEADITELVGYDLIGLGCPTFAFKEPVNVARFIRSMGPLEGKHCFIFSTHGGHPGDTLPSMGGKLRRLGLKVIGGFNCDGADRMPHFTFPWFTAGHPDEVDLEAAASFGKQMVERSQRLSRGERVPMPSFHRIETPLQRQMLKVTKINKPLSRGFYYRMTYSREKCLYPKCHLCVDNCPVNAIDLSVHPAIFRRGCISCYFCEMLCPTGAIEFDSESVEATRKVRVESFLSRKYPEFFERAKNELIDNRGTLFRLLVDKVEIGNIDGAYGLAYTKRPRYVIRG